MIKGLYNENEFYTNFYWDSKLIEDIRSKLEPSADLKVAELKALDGLFWKLKELSINERAPTDALVNFYSAVFKTLGFQFQAKLNQTSDGASYSSFISETKAGSLELVGLLTDYVETGTFETEPILIKAEDDIEVSSNDLQFTDLLREELLESESPPRWVLIGSPAALFIIERSKWSVGRYLRIEWQEIFLQRDSKPYEIIMGICSKKILCPEAGNSSHDEYDDNSHRHAFEVTTELRESVREAIELLINEMIDLKKESHQKIYAAETSDQYAKELTHDALYYVYRLLFLLYLEAQGDDSDLLPLKSEIYRNGYSLEKLLELDFVDIAPDSAESKGTFLFESLDQIFNLIFFGFEPGVKEGLLKAENSQTGFLIKGVKSDLFDPTALKHVTGVKLTNGVILEIIKKLSLTRKRDRGGKPRARVSYANLGINQLGAIYEGLLSYTGFFAQEDLHALKPASVKQGDIDSGKEQSQIYLAPKAMVEKYRIVRNLKYKLTEKNIVSDGDGNPKIYKKGSFIYRMAGRDRQKLASYYTPESLTKSTVRYSLKVLFESKSTLEDLWKVKILEPAMGSGAFLNEAVNQLTNKILELEVQQGIGDLDSPKSKKRRIWEIKYILISKNVFGVDLNPVAVELARFSLWLNCIGAGKPPPNFEGKLKVGNSLMGADLKKTADGICNILQFHEKMLNFSPKLKNYNENLSKRVKAKRTALLSTQLSKNDQRVVELQRQIEVVIINLISHELSIKLLAYQRLKRCCDLWCSMFFCNDTLLNVLPNTHHEYLNAIEDILNGRESNTSNILNKLVEEIAIEERFFHWDIEYPEQIASGFELILGNPPWVAVEWHEEQQVEDFFPIPAIKELDAKAAQELVSNSFSVDQLELVAKRLIRYEGYSNLLECDRFRVLSGVSKNTYKFFIPLAYGLSCNGGAIGLIHEDGIYEDLRSEPLRAHIFKRLRYHFHFVNQKGLFEIGNTRSYSVNICGSDRSSIDFIHIGNLFVTSTIEACFGSINGDGETPGIKNEKDEWDVTGHPNRIVRVTPDVLDIFAGVANLTTNAPPLFNLHSNSLLNFLRIIQRPTSRIGDLVGETYIAGGMFEAKSAQAEGLIIQKNLKAAATSDIVLSGPHICRGSMFGQETKEQYDNHRSYVEVDLTSITDNWKPRVLYHHESGFTDQHFATYALNGRPYRSHYRLAYRERFDVQSERCFYVCIIPPGVSHVDLIESVASVNSLSIAVTAGYCMSLCYEAIARIKNLKHCRYNELKGFPVGAASTFNSSIARRTVVLNALTSDYDALEDELSIFNIEDEMSNGVEIPVNREERRILSRDENIRTLLSCEIDALVAISLDIDADTYRGIYKTLMPVLSMYDRKSGIDRVRLVESARIHFVERGW